MFEAGYGFRLATKRIVKDDYPLLEKYIYVFRPRLKRTYIVNIHRYEHRAYVIKFHDKNHSDAKDKYTFVLNDFDTGRVLKTVFEIAVSILRADQFASFAFIGAHKYGKESATAHNTQRYRVYKRMVEYFLGTSTFVHLYEQRSNSYLLVNKTNARPEVASEAIINMFAEIFQGLEP